VKIDVYQFCGLLLYLRTNTLNIIKDSRKLAVHTFRAQ